LVFQWVVVLSEPTPALLDTTGPSPYSVHISLIYTIHHTESYILTNLATILRSMRN